MAQQGNPPPQARYSTHEWTAPVPVNPIGGLEVPSNFQEWMVDAKTPGDGRTYVAGTITVNRTNTLPTPLFSNSPVSPSAGLGDFDAGDNGSALNQRQIGILQIVNNADQSFLHQRYFHGRSFVGSPEEEVFDRATNVRGISVWPTGVPGTTRIAICGETFDEVLPLSNAPAGSPLASSGGSASGFVAVYDGAGTLLWTHHFFGVSVVGQCVVTDLSIRVDSTGADIVTYCGVSSHGNPLANDTLTVVAPFRRPTVTGDPNPAEGNTDNGPANWDGFVGRLVRPAPATPTNHVFHSVVGGIRQDGLFGLAEIDRDRFAVVGSTGTTTVPATGTATFPLTSTPLNGITGYTIGVLMVFDTSTLFATTPFLTLESGYALGNPSLGGKTVARDLVVQPRYWAGQTAMAVVVGSTDDAALMGTLAFGAALGPQAVIGGGVDGFIVSAALFPTHSPVFVAATFRGTEGNQWLTGVNAWNEFTDHFVVTGVTTGTGGSAIDVASFVIDTDIGAIAAPFVALTSATMDGTSQDGPTAIGAANATTSFWPFGLGDPAGGGIAVDEKARVTVVGATNSPASLVAGFPATAAGPINYRFAAGRNKTDILIGAGPSNDGTRTVLDMLPGKPLPNPGGQVLGAVGRTDGTGQLPTGNAFGTPTYPLMTLTFPTSGGTTPECSLPPFGLQIGGTLLPSRNKRMLIDYEGPLPGAGASIRLIVSRPPASFGEVSAWQIGFPGSPTPPILMPAGWVLWIDPNASVTFAHASADATLRSLPLVLPTGAGTLAVQLVCLPAGTVNGNPPGGSCSTPTQFVASPAMWIQY